MKKRNTEKDKQVQIFNSLGYWDHCPPSLPMMRTRKTLASQTQLGCRHCHYRLDCHGSQSHSTTSLTTAPVMYGLHQQRHHYLLVHQMVNIQMATGAAVEVAHAGCTANFLTLPVNRRSCPQTKMMVRRLVAESSLGTWSAQARIPNSIDCTLTRLLWNLTSLLKATNRVSKCLV